jgi:hypothetical protein
MEWFEDNIEPHVPDAAAVADFKGLVRAKMNALAVDAIDVMNLSTNEEINGYAIETTEWLFPNGRDTCILSTRVAIAVARELGSAPARSPVRWWS